MCAGLVFWPSYNKQQHWGKAKKVSVWASRAVGEEKVLCWGGQQPDTLTDCFGVRCCALRKDGSGLVPAVLSSAHLISVKRQFKHRRAWSLHTDTCNLPGSTLALPSLLLSAAQVTCDMNKQPSGRRPNSFIIAHPGGSTGFFLLPEALPRWCLDAARACSGWIRWSAAVCTHARRHVALRQLGRGLQPGRLWSTSPADLSGRQLMDMLLFQACSVWHTSFGCFVLHKRQHLPKQT